MKIVIELSDQDLQKSIEAQVGKSVAAYTEAIIKAKVDAIVQLKLDRLGDADLKAAMKEAVKERIDVALGGTNDWSRQQAIKHILADAAMAAIKGARS